MFAGAFAFAALPKDAGAQNLPGPSSPQVPVSAERRFFAEIRPDQRNHSRFPTRFAKIEAQIVSRGWRIERRLLGDEVIYIVMSAPQSLATSSLDSLRSELLSGGVISDIFTQESANLRVRTTSGLEAYPATVRLSDDQLRGLPGKRQRLRVDLDAPHVPGELVVMRRSLQNEESLTRQTILERHMALHARVGARVMSAQPGPDRRTLELVELADRSRAAMASAIAAYLADPDIEFAEPNYQVFKRATPNDPYFTSGLQYGLNRISAPNAWDIRTSTNAVIAVLDDGLYTGHPDLQPSLWTNPGEIADGVDNDGNGIVDDLHGFNAATMSGSPQTTFGHGTQVAGVAGARGNNSRGVAGVAWEAKIMGIQIYGSSQTATINHINTAVNYAIAKGASVVNASWGFYTYSAALENAVQNLKNAGIPIICAADNINNDMDFTQDYPSWHFRTNILTVTASDSADNKASFAQRGRWMVDLAAPGVSIASTDGTSGGSEGYVTTLNGTSFATPHVTGSYALLKSHFPGENFSDLLDRIRFSVDELRSFNGLTATNGRLNLHKALGVRPKLFNLSTRCDVRSGGEIAIAGLVITGSTPKKIAFRAQGPSLTAYGVPNALSNPQIQLYPSGGSPIGYNDDWGTLDAASQSDLQANGITPSDPNDSALVVTLNPGAYTVHLSGVGGVEGNAIIEAFDISGHVSSRMINVSTRCYVGTGDNVAIAGLIVHGDKPRRVFIRALGPSLGYLFGVTNALPNPRIELFAGNQSIDSNDNWRDYDGSSVALEGRLGGTGFAPFDNLDSAIVRILAPGSYTVVLSGVNGATGVGIIEVNEF